MAAVFVLEDEEPSRKALVNMLQSIAKDITVCGAADLAEARLLLRSAVSFDLFLLDINLDADNREDQSGILFAEEVRAVQKYAFTPLVMVTSVAGMEMDAYRKLHCYQYIVKPYEQKEIEALVKRVLTSLTLQKRQFLIVKKQGINYRIACDEIVFCKAIPRGVCLYLTGEQMEVPYLSIRQLMEKLPGDEFFQCHRMFVVNRSKVRYYDLVNQIIQVEGYDDRIDIGVTFRSNVRRVMYE